MQVLPEHGPANDDDQPPEAGGKTPKSDHSACTWTMIDTAVCPERGLWHSESGIDRMVVDAGSRLADGRRAPRGASVGNDVCISDVDLLALHNEAQHEAALSRRY